MPGVLLFGCGHSQRNSALQLSAVAAVFSFALSTPGSVGLLLTIPLISYVFCGRFVAQHYGIARIGTYIHDHLSHRIPGGLHWEQWLRSHRRTDRTINWALPLLLTFPGASALAEAWVFPHVFTRQGIPPWDQWILVVLWVTGAIATTLCTYLIVNLAWKPAWLFPHAPRSGGVGGEPSRAESDSDQDAQIAPTGSME